MEPSELITVERLSAAVDSVQPGDRLLLRTDWSHRLGKPEYRDALPRISRELARWLVEKEVALVGVEAPSVADVNDLPEVTEVHQTLFRGGVVIVEARESRSAHATDRRVHRIASQSDRRRRKPRSGDRG